MLRSERSSFEAHGGVFSVRRDFRVAERGALGVEEAEVVRAVQVGRGRVLAEDGELLGSLEVMINLTAIEIRHFEFRVRWLKEHGLRNTLCCFARWKKCAMSSHGRPGGRTTKSALRKSSSSTIVDRYFCHTSLTISLRRAIRCAGRTLIAATAWERESRWGSLAFFPLAFNLTPSQYSSGASQNLAARLDLSQRRNRTAAMSGEWFSRSRGSSSSTSLSSELSESVSSSDSSASSSLPTSDD